MDYILEGTADVSMDIVLIQRKGIKLDTNTAKPIWLACIFEKMPRIEEIWPLYRLRFNVDHWNKFALAKITLD